MIRDAGLTILVAMLCQTLMAQDQPAAHHYFSKKPHEPLAKWGYDGPTGPQFWGQLNPSYKLASTGKQQSPIEINTRNTSLVDLPDLKFDYRRERISAVNNGHTIQHDKAPGSYLYVGDERYALEQFHVHTPSEHTIDGKRFDMEIHFVHKSVIGEVVVVAVMVTGDNRADLDFPLYHDLPEKAGEFVYFDGTRNPSDYLPRSREYFSYSGSFTTPPCTENIHWIVMRQPLGVQPKLIERFVTILKFNNRPVQMLYGRVVQKSQ